MKLNPFKGVVLFFLIFGAVLPGAMKSFAQDDTSSDNQGDEAAREAQTQQALNQIQDLEAKMEENGKKLDALEKAVQAIPEQVTTVPTEPVAVEQAPIQIASVEPSSAPKEQVSAQIKVEPVDLLPETSLHNENQFKIALDYSYTTYKEQNYDVEEKGPFYGLYGAYDFRPDNEAWPGIVMHADSDFNFGLIKYSSPDAWAKNVRDYLIEPRVWLGRDIPILSFTRVTPYVGVGYRFLFDHLGALSDIGGYDRQSQYLYAPVGFEFDTQAIQGWELGFDAEYDIFIRGWQKSYLSDISSDYPNLNNRQDRGYGLRGSIDIIKKLDRVNLFISPYIKYWNIRQSKSDVAFKLTGDYIYYVEGYEPSNNSTEIGVRLGVEF